MLISIQFPLVDLRTFLPGRGGRLSLPQWPQPRADLDFVRSFGPIRARPRDRDDPGRGPEPLVCEAHNALRFTKVPRRFKVVYRRFHFDGIATAKFDIGLSTTSLERPSEPAALARCIAGVLALEVSIAPGPHKTGATTLGTAAGRLAMAYQDASSAHSVERTGKLVLPGRPQIVVEVGPGDVFILPPEAREIARASDAGLRAYALTLAGPSSPPAWILDAREATAPVSRETRVTLSRLHAEYESLELILRETARRALVVPEGAPEQRAFVTYLSHALKRISKSSRRETSLAEDLWKARRGRDADLMANRAREALAELNVPRQIARNTLRTAFGAPEVKMRKGMRPARDVVGTIDVGLITIRQDEFDAALKRFPRTFVGSGTGGRVYQVSDQKTKSGRRLRVAVARTPLQGNGPAQETASYLIQDLRPKCVFLVGIAGGVAGTEISLGDVVIATAVQDLRLRALVQDKPDEHAVYGGPISKSSMVLAANLVDKDVRGWNTEESLGCVRPPVPLDKDRFYGSASQRARVEASITHHFGPQGPVRPPTFMSGSIVTDDALIKSVDVVDQWDAYARQAVATEMEAAGVLYACNHDTGLVPAFVVRGLSDIVGYRRSPEWTTFACQAAAAFANALIRSAVFEATILAKDVEEMEATS